MRIPLYTAQSRATSEAPGRSITARKNVQAAAQSELAKAAPFSAFADEVSKFSLERFKVVRNNLLNEADLAMDESMFELARKLEKSGNYNTILDGENPTWKSGTDAIKTELLGKVGKDDFSQKQFNLRFGQNELKHRFQLRSEVDRQIKIASQGNYSKKLVKGESELSDWRLDKKARDAITRPINVFTGTYINQTKANPEKVKATIKAMEINAARAALTRYISEQPGKEITTLTAMREALRNGRNGETLEGPSGSQTLPAPLVGGENLYERLIAFDDDELASIINTTSGDIATIYGPGFEERARGSQLKATSTYLKSSADTLLSQMELEKADATKVADLLGAFNKHINDNPNVSADVISKRDELNLINEFSIISQKASVTNMDAIISDFKDGKMLGGKGMDTEAEQKTLKFLESRRDKMEVALKEDAIQWATDNGLIPEPPESAKLVNEDGTFNQSFVELRKVQAETVQDYYGLPATQFLTKNEVKEFGQYLNKKEIAPETRLAYLQNFVQAWGKNAKDVFLQMEIKNAVTQSALGSLVNGGNFETAKLILFGMDKVNAGETINETSANLKTALENITTGSDNKDILMNMRPEDKAVTVELATAHYLGKGYVEYDEERWIESYQAALGRDGDKGGIQDVNGEPVILPQNFTPIMAENVLDNLANFHLRFMEMDVGGDPAGRTIDRDLLMDINNNSDYVLRYIGGTNYFIFDTARNKVVSYPPELDPEGNPEYLEKVIIDLNLLLDSFPAIVQQRNNPTKPVIPPDFSGITN
jgi:hypothetical protein